MREAIREGIREEMRADETILLYGQDERDGESFDVTTGLYEEFGGRRVRNTPISEAAQVGSAVGAAATGLRPVVELNFANFIGVCFDQIMNQVGNTRYMFGGASEVPLVLRATEGGGIGAAAQHSTTPHTLIAHLPGIKTVAPATPAGAKGLIKTSIRSDDPVMFFENTEPKLYYSPVRFDHSHRSSAIGVRENGGPTPARRRRSARNHHDSTRPRGRKAHC